MCSPRQIPPYLLLKAGTVSFKKNLAFAAAAWQIEEIYGKTIIRDPPTYLMVIFSNNVENNTGKKSIGDKEA